MKITFKMLTIALAMTVSFSANALEEEWVANGGISGIINTGNAENSTFGGNALVSYKYDRNMFSWTTDGSYGRATDALGIASTNARNWNTGLRYDRFITDPLSVYALGFIGENKPAGFDSRFGAATGVAYTFFDNEDVNALRGEAGYHWAHEERVAAADADIHSARLFAQYTHKLNENVYFGQDVESLFNLQESDDIRVNTLTSLILKLSEKVGFQVGYQVRFDNDPVAGFEKTDTQTQMGLSVNFL